MDRVHSKEFAANYRGRDVDFPNGYVGPNTLGEYFRPVSSTYNPETDMTRVVFEIVPRS